MDLLDKFSPSHIDNIIGNKILINNFIEQLIENKNKIICLLGPNGCGKTLIAKLVLNHLNYNILEITRNNNTNKELSNLLSNYINNATIDSFFSKKKKIILIDSIDILLQTERNIISIINQNIPFLYSQNVSIVITCKKNEEKKLLDFKNDIHFINMFYPDPDEVYAVLLVFLNNNNIIYDQSHLKHLIHKFKGNIRETLLNLHITKNNIDLMGIQKKFYDSHTFDIVGDFLKKQHTLEEIQIFLKNDNNLMSFVLYENIPEELNNRDFKKTINYDKSFIREYREINNYYLISTQFENYMYNNTDFIFNEYVNFIKLRGTNYILNDIKKKKNKLALPINFRFSQILSKISHKNIMNIKIMNIIRDNFNISYLEILYIVDSIINNKKEFLHLKKKKKTNGDLLNLINTYNKYFNE